MRSQVGRVDNTVIEVEGNTMGLGLGNLVSLRPGPDGADGEPLWSEEDFSKQYLVVGASYSLSVDQYETGDVAFSDEPFKASYQLLDSHTQFRPARVTRKPHMPGRQTALVVGPANEEIWTDKHGRVMVQFDWDRLGERNEKASCWIRVAQPWSGAKFGAQYLPRVGQEVIVAFLDGDPDRPIITGSLFNKDNMPPYDLPANQTQSGIKSRSSKGGTASNFNELRFEDKKGQEELHLQAEKDMSTLVKHDQTLHVGANRGLVVGNDETNLVKNERQLTVDANDSVVIGGTHDKTVTGAVTQLYGGDHSRKVDGEQAFFAEKNKDEHVKLAHKLTTDKKFQLNQGATSMTFKGTNVTVDSAGTITLTAGGATVCLDKTGKATFDSPTGIKFVCGASSLAILPGGVAIASPAVTAAAGASSVVAMGEETAAMKSKTVTIEADGVCTIKGKSALKLQEAEGVKGKKARASSKVGKGQDTSARSSSHNAEGSAQMTRPAEEALVEEYSTQAATMSEAKCEPDRTLADHCDHAKYPDIERDTNSFACSSGAFAWTGKFDILLKRGELEIRVKIKLVNRQGAKAATGTTPLPPIGPPLSPAEKATMKADIEGKLGGKWLFHRAHCKNGGGCGCPKNRGCCKIPVKIVVEFVESGHHHEVNLFQGAGRANATNWTRVKTRENSYAHETGHLLGFYDEYAGGAVGKPPRWKVRPGVIMSTGLAVPVEYYWDFRDWLKTRCQGEEWAELLP